MKLPVLLASLLAVACGSSNKAAESTKTSPDQPAAVSTDPANATKPGAPAAPTAGGAVEQSPDGSFAGAIHIGAVALLPNPVSKPVTGYPNKKVHIGVFPDKASWDKFMAKANINPFATQDMSLDFQKHVVVYVVFDGQTNAFGFKSWSRDNSGKGTLTIQWERTEQHMVSTTPAVLVAVDRASLKSIEVRSADGVIGSKTL